MSDNEYTNRVSSMFDRSNYPAHYEACDNCHHLYDESHICNKCKCCFDCCMCDYDPNANDDEEQEQS